MKELSAPLSFLAPKNQNEVGVFAFYVFFKADIDQKLSAVAITSVTGDKMVQTISPPVYSLINQRHPHQIHQSSNRLLFPA